MTNPTPIHPVDAAGPVDGREPRRASDDGRRAAAHRTLEIPPGFPQAPTGSTGLRGTNV